MAILAFTMRSQDGSYFQNEVFPLNMGEEAGFERLFLLYHAPLCFFCEKVTGNSDSGEDIVSQLFLTLWQRQTVFESANHAQAFLYRSARNACLNFIRTEQRAKSKQEAAAQVLSEEPVDYLQTFIRTETMAELYRAIASLPLQCRKVINLSYMEGLSNQEIADELDLSLQTVKNYKLRGLGLLKNKLPDSLFILVAVCLLK